ncbi:aminopeptidase, partial [Candidatus Calescamantes bacterium]|nr:aminopeptidase [Candidatus Calescamantes bacterium]
MLDSPQPKYTSIAFLIDKEEIGSDGATGAQSNWLADIIADLLQREDKVSDHYTLSRTMHLSEAISADVNAAVNPL